jgi:opacity protein-like surface antigen
MALLYFAFVPCQLFASEPEKKMYVSFNLGPGLESGVSATDGASGKEFEFKTGSIVGAGLGYRLHRNYRIEAVFERRENSVDDPSCDPSFSGTVCFVPGGAADSGDMIVNSFLVNFYGELRQDEFQSIYPFAGIGLGTASITAELERNLFLVANSSARVFAYQFILGVGWDMNPNWAFTLAFRYFATQNPKLTNIFGQDINAKYQRPEGALTVMYRFF